MVHINKMNIHGHNERLSDIMATAHKECNWCLQMLRQMVFPDLGPCLLGGRIQAEPVDGVKWNSFIEGTRSHGVCQVTEEKKGGGLLAGLFFFLSIT
jgi:hypothetical protein